MIISRIARLIMAIPPIIQPLIIPECIIGSSYFIMPRIIAGMPSFAKRSNSRA
jgi:hypothetical protein